MKSEDTKCMSLEALGVVVLQWVLATFHQLPQQELLAWDPGVASLHMQW